MGPRIILKIPDAVSYTPLDVYKRQGESFGAVSLTNGKVYECIGIESFPDFTVLRIIDDSDEDYLYSPTKPAPLDGSSPGGR